MKLSFLKPLMAKVKTPFVLFLIGLMVVVLMYNQFTDSHARLTETYAVRGGLTYGDVEGFTQDKKNKDGAKSPFQTMGGSADEKQKPPPPPRDGSGNKMRPAEPFENAQEDPLKKPKFG
jgi:hypothetical protein